MTSPARSAPGPSVAVLVTSFNRRRLTLRCIGDVLAQLEGVAQTDVFLVDDASPDGTAGAVRAAFPEVVVIDGPGDLYWSRGMELAWRTASQRGYDYYLWVNDDIELDPGALAAFVESGRRLNAEGGPTVLVGALRDPHTGRTTYSGRRRTSHWHPTRSELVDPHPSQPLIAETLNGNLVLVPEAAMRTVGMIDRRFSHALGDFDYGLRATKRGVRVLVAPGYYGCCAWNPSRRMGLRELVRSPKGLPPRDWARMCFRHAPAPVFPLLVPLPYVRAAARTLGRFARRPLEAVAARGAP